MYRLGGHPALDAKSWAGPILLRIPPNQLLWTAFLQTSPACILIKVWDTRISQKLTFYLLPIEKGTSPVERSPDNTKPLAVGSFSPSCCASSNMILQGKVVHSLTSPTMTRKLVECICYCLVVSGFHFRADLPSPVLDLRLWPERHPISNFS